MARRATGFEMVIGRLAPRSRKLESMKVLLHPTDLPGNGWALFDQGAYRTGMIWGSGGLGKRARQAGSISTAGNFEESPSGRVIGIHVIPYATPTDAQSLLPAVHESWTRNPAANLTEITCELVDHENLQKNLQAIVHSHNSMGNNGPLTAKYVDWTESHIVASVMCSGFGDAWAWEDVESIVDLQSEKLRRMLAQNPRLGLKKR